MAEKGILITPQPGGKSIAARDAFELDDNSNARIIQRFDRSGLPCASIFPYAAPTRTGVVGTDTFNLDSLPADLTDHLIDCSDGSMLMVVSEFTNANSSTSMRVTPLMFNAAGDNCVGFLNEEPFNPVNESGTLFTRAGGLSIGRCAEWPLVGSAKIGIHVSELQAGSCTNIQLWAFVV